MAIKLRWVPIEYSDIKAYKLYRAIIGFNTPTEAPFGLIMDDDLIFKANNDTTQTIVFDQDYSVDDLITYINQRAVGATAYRDYYSNALYFRSDNRTESGYLDIIGGTSLAKFGQAPRLIQEKSEPLYVTTTLFGVEEHDDMNGLVDDYYGLTTLNSLDQESSRTALIKASAFGGELCVIEGVIYDLQGARIADVPVTARVVNPPDKVNVHGMITTKPIYTLSAENGRFSLPILQGTQVIFYIDETRVSDTVEIPYEPYVYWDNLPIYEQYRYTGTADVK